MKRILSIAFVVAVIIGLPAVVFAQTPATISINPNIPGVQNVSTAGPCGWIVNFYSFALIIAGILAFGAIVYGGVKYATSAGNPSSQSEGRAWIWSALLGVLLLACAYLILYTVNPNLTKCSFPQLSLVASSGGGGGVGGPGQPAVPPVPASGQCAGGPCQALPNCVPGPKINCGGAAGMIDTLNCIINQDPNFAVTEGYPPTVNHTSAGHNDGCSVDVAVSNSCAGVAAIQAAATSCGATSLNEYANCGGKTYGTTTGNNVHINAKKGDGGC